MVRRINVTLIALVVFTSMIVPLALGASNATTSLRENDVPFIEWSDGGLIIDESDQVRSVTALEMFYRPVYRVESDEDPDGNVSGFAHSHSFKLTIPANMSFCIYVERVNNNSATLNFDMILLDNPLTVYHTNDRQIDSFYTLKSLDGTRMISLPSIDDVEFADSGEEGAELEIKVKRSGQNSYIKFYIIYD